ncbi:MAG: hypothetical protein VXX39_03350 [Candidatus Thermoplasmatota archaeon]|nr:hypothetical protein [Candidatus Thermoplasmatota archaeon]
MMARLRGVVRYRFKDEDGDLNVVIEGDADWVESKVQQLGLGDVGFTMPIGTATFASNLSDVSKEKAKKNSRKVELEPLGDKPQDMGPTPDPSSIPVVRRPIGELNIEEAIAQAGLTRPERPDPIDLMDMLEEADEPRPVQSSISVDPMGEAWLRLLMEIVVREYGSTALATEVIEEVAGARMGNKSRLELDVWLDSLFKQGKLVKVHGGDSVGWGPSPRWLQGKI